MLTQQRYYSNQHYCKLDRPSIARSVGEPPCSNAVLPILVQLELPCYRFQQRHYSNQHYRRCDRRRIVRTVGKISCSGVELHTRAVGIVGTYGHSIDNAAQDYCRRDLSAIVRLVGYYFVQALY